jgi:hypothetical protein
MGMATDALKSVAKVRRAFGGLKNGTFAAGHLRYSPQLAALLAELRIRTLLVMTSFFPWIQAGAKDPMERAATGTRGCGSLRALLEREDGSETRDDAMKFLVSLCNKRPEVDKAPGVWLVECDTEAMTAAPIPLKDLDFPSGIGILGLAEGRGGIVAMLQRPSMLVWLTASYGVREVWPLQLARTGHSIAACDDRVYIASTGTDAIVEYNPSHGESIHWSDNPDGQDTIHLNSILWREGSLYFSALGKKKGDLWSTADEGYLKQLGSGRTVLAPIFHPHSVTADGGYLYCCESSRMNVHRSDGDCLVVDGGYVRGLLVQGGVLCVGISRGRTRSQSTGRIVDNPADPGGLTDRCGILVYHTRDGRLSESTPAGWIDLGEYSNEIYDLLAV